MIDLKRLLSKILYATILLLVSMIFINKSADNNYWYQTHLFSNSWSFNNAYKLYKKVLGKPLFIKEEGISTPVFNENSFTVGDKFLNGITLNYAPYSTVNNIKSGIVVFIGEKETYGHTIIIQGSDGVDIWYCNITNTGISLYDYVETDKIIGEPLNNKLYIVIEKDKEYLDYDKYLKNTM